MKIIIVDGVESVRIKLESLLAGQKVVLSTGSIDEAMDYLSRNSADLVIFDPALAENSGAPEEKTANKIMPPCRTRNSSEQNDHQLPRDYPEVGVASLSGRETEILELLFKGYTKESIADMLCLSYHTVKTHTRNIYRKLNVCSRAQAVYRFIGEDR